MKPKRRNPRRKRARGQDGSGGAHDAVSEEPNPQKLSLLDARRLSHRERMELYFLLGGILKANRAQVLMRLFTAFDRLSGNDPELWGRVARAANRELDCALAERPIRGERVAAAAEELRRQLTPAPKERQ
jgi:hypothetical protein